MTQIKVCGLKNDQLFSQLRTLPIDYFGFVFAPSKRQIDIQTAAKLVARIQQEFDKSVRCVGVFRNPDWSLLAEIIENVALDVIQLHGDETPALCLQLKQTYNKKIMKVFSLQSGTQVVDIIEAAERYIDVMDMMLIDTHDPQYGGGSGKTFRWEIIPEIHDWCKSRQIPLFVAGGLEADNVQSLLQDYSLNGVDVSSGVEHEGEKHFVKIKNFVERVRAYDYSS
jgi:phosphoribosylanthranilate isomerase